MNNTMNNRLISIVKADKLINKARINKLINGRVMSISVAVILIVTLLLVSQVASAHSNEDSAKAEEIIGQNISCSEISEEQLEMLGDYYMEQMHPGTAHEAMDEMMGGEGSESLKQVHINMGRSFYCGESSMMSMGTMGMMNMMGGGMMGGGMMGNMMAGKNMMSNNINYQGQRMMYGNSLYYPSNIFYLIIQVLVIIGLVLLILWLIKKINKKSKRG